MEFHILLFILFINIVHIYGINPGVQIRISQAALNYAGSVAIQDLSHGITGKSISDQHGNAHTPIGGVDYDLTGMRINSFGPPSNNIVVNPGQSVSWKASGASMSASGNWHYHYRKGFIKISDHGSFDISVSGVSFSLTVTLGVTGGRPTISSQGCAANVGDVHVKFHGGASWLYNLFDHYAEKSIQDELQKMMCEEAVKAINTDAAKSLADMKVKSDLGSGLVLDYSLVASPIFGSGFIESQHLGAIEWDGSGPPPGVIAPPLSPAPASDRHITIWISDYVMTTLSYTTYNHGLLQTYVIPEGLPDGQKAFLNTTCEGFTICIGNFIPPLAKSYPNSYLEMNLTATSPPGLKFVNKTLVAYFEGNITNYVHTPDGHKVYAFTMNGKLECELEAGMRKNNITAHITKFNPKLAVKDSKIGPISDKALNWLFDSLSNSFIKPQLNRIGHIGFELPEIDKVDYVNPQLAIEKDTLLLMTDVKYNPQ